MEQLAVMTVSSFVKMAGDRTSPITVRRIFQLVRHLKFRQSPVSRHASVVKAILFPID